MTTMLVQKVHANGWRYASLGGSLELKDGDNGTIMACIADEIIRLELYIRAPSAYRACTGMISYPAELVFSCNCPPSCRVWAADRQGRIRSRTRSIRMRCINPGGTFHSREISLNCKSAPVVFLPCFRVFQSSAATKHSQTASLVEAGRTSYRVIQVQIGASLASRMLLVNGDAGPTLAWNVHE